ncbi:MAG: hypothetical protein ACOX15_06715 [Tepidanaerobacteraceae bacterium]|jgi:hypothetical protein
MKRLLTSLISIIAVISFSGVIYANSGPVFWKGYPSANIMSLDENSPILIEREDLIFDFSNGAFDYTINGKTTANYYMVNPTNKQQSVQMAFPFVGRLPELSQEDILISADGVPVLYDVYIGDVVDYYGHPEDDKELNFDFERIIKTVTNEPYRAENFKQDQIGKLYLIEVEPTTDQRINFSVDFELDVDKTKVLTNGFNRFERHGGNIKIASGCYKPEVLEIFVLGEDIDLIMNAYSDGQLTKKTDLFTHKISTKDVELRSYLMDCVKNNDYIKLNAMFSDIQLYNTYSKALDSYLTSGYSSVEDLLQQGSLQRILILVYTVDFPGNAEKKVSVCYNISGTMDRRETADALYTYDYILNPAQNWRDFNNLNIKIIAPEEAPHIVKSSIEFTKGENNVYTAFLEKLPEYDLFFTLYSKDKITLFDKIRGKFQRPFGYFAMLLLYPIGLLIAVIIIVMVILKIKNKLRLK